MGEYLGLFLFLGILLMAFWLLIFLITFLGYWATVGALNSIMPDFFAKKEETAEHDSQGSSSTPS